MFKSQFAIPLLFLVLMPLSFIAGFTYPEIKQMLALYPRNPAFLSGIVGTIFVHKDLEHFSSNCLPLFVCLFGIYFFYRELANKVLSLSILLTGLLIWLFARPAFHIGASGLVYSLVLFVLVSGIIRRNKKLRVFALLVLVFQSGLLWGIFPMDNEVSWESHLFGAITGSLMAFLFRHQGPLPDRQTEWNEEDMQEEEDEYAGI